MVKETMKRKKPSFNETYYGFRSFSSLLEDAQRRGVVTLRRDQKSGSYIVEDLGAAARGDGSIVTPRPSEVEAVAMSVPPAPTSTTPSSNDQGPSAPSSGASTNGHGTSGRGESRGDREPRPERRPAPTATAPPMVAASTVSAPVPPVAAATGAVDEIAAGPEADAPDGEAPSRPRRRRGGRGRGRGRDGGEREARPDLEARGEESLPLEEDSNPALPILPQAAAAYAEVVERMAKTDAPVFWEVPALTTPALKAPLAADLPPIALPAPAHRHEAAEPVEAAPVRATEARPEEPAVPVVKPASPKPTPPVAPVDPSKASFSLLGWLKGGG
jgi:hypothetical protein